MYPLRFAHGALESGKSTIEITARTLQGRYLLKPDPNVNSIIAGVLARAKKRYGVELHGFVAMSSHMHLLISVDGVKQQSSFMRYVMSNVARKISRYLGWSGKLWQRRYRGIEVNRDEASLLDRFDYILRHGPKEGLVACPTEWPGLHCASYYERGQWEVRGHWDDQTKAYRLRQAGQRVRMKDYRLQEVLEIDPLPCWHHLERKEIMQWVRDRLELIRNDYRDEVFLGVKKVLQQSIYDQALEQKRSPAPSVHCKDPTRRQEMRTAYREFVKVFYAAAARLAHLCKAQEDPYYFPSGCHPPFPPAVPEHA